MLTQCPHCKQVYEVPDDVPLKTELQCPACQNKFLLKPYSEGGRNASAAQNHTTQNSNNSVSAQAGEDSLCYALEKHFPLVAARIFIGIIIIIVSTVFIKTSVDKHMDEVIIFLVLTIGLILLFCIYSIVSGVIRAVLETRDNTQAIRELLARNLENK